MGYVQHALGWLKYLNMFFRFFAWILGNTSSCFYMDGVYAKQGITQHKPGWRLRSGRLFCHKQKEFLNRQLGCWRTKCHLTSPDNFSYLLFFVHNLKKLSKQHSSYLRFTFNALHGVGVSLLLTWMTTCWHVLVMLLVLSQNKMLNKQTTGLRFAIICKRQLRFEG